jgi:hypothetical protein
MQHLYNQGKLNQGRLIQAKHGAVPAYQRYFGKMQVVPIQWISTLYNHKDFRRITKTCSHEPDFVLDPLSGRGDHCWFLFQPSKNILTEYDLSNYFTLENKALGAFRKESWHQYFELCLIS